MKTIYKFILKSYISPMVVTFFIVMFVLMMNFVWRYIDELVGKGLDMGVITELMLYAMANMIPMGLPLATLFAAIMTMGNLGENYELLAMKSAGMSLPQILRPLAIVILFVSVASFFVANNLVPYANKKMFSILYDIRQQKQALEFKDGLFFNGIDNMSIRVGHQDPETKLLTDVLIYDNRKPGGNMSVTAADSGYIRLSDDKRFLLVTLYHGETYNMTRDIQWYDKSSLDHYIFDEQNGMIPMEGFDFKRSDESGFSSNSQTRNIVELERDIDSLDRLVNQSATGSYGPLLQDYLFRNYPELFVDSLLATVEGHQHPMLVEDSIKGLRTREAGKIYNDAYKQALNSSNVLTFDETASKDSLNKLYRAKVEWHRKMSLPVSIMIFFLIGAALGAIIRKGGLGMPVIVSVAFFVIYYVISLTGEKMTKEGTWEAFIGMWVSTYILFPVAIYLTYKATNDSNLLNMDWYIIKYRQLKKYFSDRFSHKSNLKSKKI